MLRSKDLFGFFCSVLVSHPQEMETVVKTETVITVTKKTTVEEYNPFDDDDYDTGSLNSKEYVAVLSK